jgi:hypothetical protein
MEAMNASVNANNRVAAQPTTCTNSGSTNNEHKSNGSDNGLNGGESVMNIGRQLAAMSLTARVDLVHARQEHLMRQVGV